MTTPLPPSSDARSSGPPDDRAVRFRWPFLDAADRSVLMAVLNVTPDSFSDGGELTTPAAVVARARVAEAEGADLLDLGGESTRPGAQRVSPAEQIRRVVPALRALREAGIGLPVSVDTTRAEVAQAALDAGAVIVNDVSGGTEDPEMLGLIARTGAGCVLMHRAAPPGRDVYSTAYDTEPEYPGGVVDAVRTALVDLVARALSAGVAREQIVVDPGLGFGKSVGQNARLLARASAFQGLGSGVLIGASRKSFLGALTGEPEPARRVPESVAAAVLGRWAGANVFRVHDIDPHRRALDVADAAVRHARE